MKDFSRARLLGGIGSILIILAVMPVIGFVISLVGFVMVVMAVYYVAQTTKNKRIFNDYTLSVVILLVGLAIAVLYISLAVLSPGVSSAINSIANSTKTNSSSLLSNIPVLDTILMPIAVFAAILIASFVVSAIFLRRSFKAIAQQVGVKLFDTASLLFLIGAALLVLFGIGAIVIFVAIILQAVAFFSLPMGAKRHGAR